MGTTLVLSLSLRDEVRRREEITRGTTSEELLLWSRTMGLRPVSRLPALVDRHSLRDPGALETPFVQESS